jgi:large subunit ribosomal protein L18
MKATKQSRRTKIKRGIRSKIFGTAERPRLSVFRSNNEIYGQIIDDVQGTTLVSASSHSKDYDGKGKTRIQISQEVGNALAAKAIAAGINTIVFDRNGYLYHGRIKSFAEGARAGGLQF